MNTAALKRFSQQARVILIEGVQARLKYWGFDSKGKVTEKPEQVGGGVIFRGEGIDDVTLYKKWEALEKAIKTHGIKHVVEEAAYTWFNRLMAIRILAKNGYIPPQLEYESELLHVPIIVGNARRGLIPEMAIENRNQLNDLLKDDSAETEQFALLITAYCRSNKLLNRVFGRLNDYTELLLPKNILSGNGFIQLLNDNGFISDDDYKEAELIGWLYQFYISEKKDEVFKSFKKKKKAEAEDIPAATQIFTPNWIVKYMVQNTLGRIWLDLNPDSNIKFKMDFLVENPDAIESEPLVSEVAALKLLDPACGSGHILVEGLDLLFDMYMEEGYSTREATRSILCNNLYGLDIDLRAAQLANYALLLKAAAKDPTILEEDVVPQVYAMPEPHKFSDECLKIFLGEDVQYEEKLKGALTLMLQSQNLGSIMKFHVGPEIRKTLQTQLSYWEKRQNTISDIFLKEEFSYLFPYIRIILLLTDKYEAVAANPPYMGSGNMNTDLKRYINKNYPQSKRDLFSVFMEVGIQFCNEEGRMGMINMHSWMFITSFKEIRKEIIDNFFIESMLHLGPRTFDELSGEVVQNTTFILKNTSNIGKGIYYRLVDGKDSSSKEKMFLLDEGRFEQISQSNFDRIPESPISFWASDKIYKSYKNKLLKNGYHLKAGLQTGNNDLFLRFFWEISSLSEKYMPYDKGGPKKKWYGNNFYLINWGNEGEELQSTNKAVFRNKSFYFNEGISYSLTSSTNICARHRPHGFIFDNQGSSLFEINKTYESTFALALLNSKVTNYYIQFLNPTMVTQVGDLSRIPLIYKNIGISVYVKENTSISQLDWDSRETSWDFSQDEIIRQEKKTISEAYQSYQQYWTEQFTQLHTNEVELNRIFIDIYGLQDELTPEVKLKDITILQEELDYNVLGELTEMEQLPDPSQLPIKADEVMKQFVSYAIGCIMGRYKLDQPGLHIAHLNPTDEELLPYNYRDKKFIIDDDAIVPLMGTSCGFADNALQRVKSLIRQVWGFETEIENINFLEESLGKDLETYLVNDFWNDHCKRYQKRPIYWLFSSPKGAFQVLVYVHRMNKYTVDKIRSNYLLKHIQNLSSKREMLEKESASLDRKGQRELTKIANDLEECRAYDMVLKNVADQQIEFDLDDGVKVNYAKFDGVVAKIK
jgi:hypothetical protein